MRRGQRRDESMSDTGHQTDRPETRRKEEREGGKGKEKENQWMLGREEGRTGAKKLV